MSYSGQPGLVSRSGVTPVSDAGTLQSGEQHVYSAQFIIDEIAFSAPFISNSMKVTGDSNGFTGNVSDTSDDGDDSDGNTEDDMTIVEMTSASSQTTIFPELEVIKSAVVSDTGNDGNNLGDVITFFITIKNVICWNMN